MTDTQLIALMSATLWGSINDERSTKTREEIAIELAEELLELAEKGDHEP